MAKFEWNVYAKMALAALAIVFAPMIVGFLCLHFDLITLPPGCAASEEPIASLSWMVGITVIFFSWTILNVLYVLCGGKNCKIQDVL